ncbi:hypothetical protein RHGRI_017806 [Rhododendron griersonianum]|uniref:Uncharacterized protein n=1 Tax=Rhododendron griersonianum TaxID=479676 RepID=A0AAV6JZ62_9ERIC|nr:hypothetical protein RHGRI_017806 [Rhododendron griersonianum]
MNYLIELSVLDHWFPLTHFLLISVLAVWFYVARTHMAVDFPPFMVLIIAILNDGTIMTISKDRVKSSPQPDSWKLAEIFTTGVILGGYLAMMTVQDRLFSCK